MRDIFIIGSKGIPAKYGGFETFVDQLTRHKKSKDIQYHVACMADKSCEFSYQDSHCFGMKVPPIGPAKAVWYDIAAFLYCIRYLKKHPSKEPVIYILACRIGPFMCILKHMLKRLGGKIYVNPDGHEWMRAKWNKAIRRYWKFSEKLMVKHADLLICDSKNIEKYIKNTYQKYQPNTTFIAYGADVASSTLADTDEKLLDWYDKWQLKAHEYYLIVGRFVPENNYETMIREFMQAKTDKKLAIISNVEENPFYRKLQEETGFEKDRRIVFCQTVYDEQLLKKIRENAWGYLHGHEVGGTNPSLLEALGSTKVNLLLDVGFNREVGEDTALYWKKDKGSLAQLIDVAADLDDEERNRLGKAAKARILAAYSQEKIADAYEKIFLA
ncbi:MAG: DUF1972 domain-containing protein [Lachnospiraceae bacterium]|nr:DUF1972 domain-containing protein [Lachnospiraceae bacterium]